MKSGIGVTEAQPVTNGMDWFDSKMPLKLHFDYPHKESMRFRKKYLRGFLLPGSCNYYIAASSEHRLWGLLGFANPEYGNYDLLLKADTTTGEYASNDLLLYLLRTCIVKEKLENYFNRNIENAYSMCFSHAPEINRYRRHGKKIKAEKILVDKNIIGYNVGYLFNLGTIKTIKEARSLWLQKWKANKR